MKKRRFLFLWLGILSLFLCGLYPGITTAQFYPFFGATNPLLSTSYVGGFLNPYYYNTLAPITSFGQFDPSISLDEVTLSLDILYSPTELRTYNPSSLQGLYNFSPAPFNYLWNSMLASQDETVTINPYFATPFYYPLLNKDYFVSNIPERTVPLSLFSLYSFTPHLPELLYTAWQADLAPEQSFINTLGLSFLPII